MYARKSDISDKDSILGYQSLLSLFKKVLPINWSTRQISKYQKYYQITKNCLSWTEPGIVPIALGRKAK